jgi:hypothetical protein
MRDELEETKDVVVKHVAKHEHVDVQAMAWCKMPILEKIRFAMASLKSNGSMLRRGRFARETVEAHRASASW